jgi:Excalibur calcium-binding domain
MKKRVAGILLMGMALGMHAAPAEAKVKVSKLRGGLYCKDLKRMGYTYSEAVRYWYNWDSPSNMDADDNGIPCETLYTAASVKRIFPDYSSY